MSGDWKTSCRQQSWRRRLEFIALALPFFLIVPLSAYGQTRPALDGPVVFHVSPDGDDAHDGSAAAPFAELQTALRQARLLRHQNDPAIAHGVRIILHDGVYSLSEPLRIGPQDSGDPASPTRIEAAPDSHPILSGGVALTGWRPADQIIYGLPFAAQGRLWMCPIPRFNGQPLRFRQLWVNGRKAIWARTPNADQPTAHLLSWNDKTCEAGIDDRYVDNLSPEGIEIVLRQQWEIAILRLKSIRSDAGHDALGFAEPESRIEFSHPWPQPILPPKGSASFFLQNSVHFLDEPGEWFEDLDAGRIYYWPREGEAMDRDPVVAPSLETIVDIAGTVDQPVGNIAFHGIGFEYSTWLTPSFAGHVPLQDGMPMVEAYRIPKTATAYSTGLDNLDWVARLPAAVRISGAHHIAFERCAFSHTAASALDDQKATHDDSIEGCVFSDIGGNGIQMGSFQEYPVETHLPYNPSDPREICALERIANNLITDTANEDWGCVGIGVGYARGVIIEHNDIGPTSYTGISVGWGWTPAPNALRDNIVHANYCHTIATRMCDTGAIYTLSAQPGTIVSENRVDPIQLNPDVDYPTAWHYLYADEGSAYLTVRDNWTPAPNFLQNANGPGNTWTRNGPMVSETIKNAAGLEAPFRDLLPTTRP